MRSEKSRSDKRRSGKRRSAIFNFYQVRSFGPFIKSSHLFDTNFNNIKFVIFYLSFYRSASLIGSNIPFQMIDDVLTRITLGWKNLKKKPRWSFLLPDLGPFLTIRIPSITSKNQLPWTYTSLVVSVCSTLLDIFIYKTKHLIFKHLNKLSHFSWKSDARLVSFKKILQFLLNWLITSRLKVMPRWLATLSIKKCCNLQVSVLWEHIK